MSDDELRNTPEGLPNSDTPPPPAQPTRSKKPNGGEGPRPRRKKATKKSEAPLPDGPLPDEAQPAPTAPRTAQQDAAEQFMQATSQSQAFVPATSGLLGRVRLGLPDREVFFKVKPIETTIGPDGKPIYQNTAIVWLYNLPDGARMSQNEPRLWMVKDTLVAAFKEKKARVEQHQLRLAVDRFGVPYMVPIAIAKGFAVDGLRTVIAQAETKWVKQYWDPKLGRMYERADDQSLVETWPVEGFAELYLLALGPVFVDTKEHDIYKRVCGA